MTEFHSHQSEIIGHSYETETNGRLERKDLKGSDMSMPLL